MAPKFNKPKLFLDITLTVALCLFLNWGMPRVALATEQPYGHFVMFVAMASFMVVMVLLYLIIYYVIHVWYFRVEKDAIDNPSDVD